MGVTHGVTQFCIFHSIFFKIINLFAYVVNVIVNSHDPSLFYHICLMKGKSSGKKSLPHSTFFFTLFIKWFHVIP